VNALVPLPVAAEPVSGVSRAAIAKRIAALLREAEANKTALRAPPASGSTRRQPRRNSASAIAACSAR
jgi:hypothetical protein